MNKWTFRFLDLAVTYGSWSKDPSTGVGAVIVKGKNDQVSQGYNGFAKGVKDTEKRLNDRTVRLQLTKHAEENAIFFCRKEDAEGSTIYISAPPCVNCASSIIQVGIARVVYIRGTDEFMERWHDDIVLAREILSEKDIMVLEHTREDYDNHKVFYTK